MKRTSLLLIAALLTSGCGGPRRTDATTEMFGQEDSDYVLAIVLDMSGSFSHLMADDGKAYDFALAVMDRYFRNGDGLNDTMVIAQISGTDESLLWQGSPLELRRDFPTADDFRRFLLANVDPNGSRVNEGLTNVVDYIAANPRVAGGNARSAVFVLSDMLDNGGDSDTTARQLDASLAAYGNRGGRVGLYYVNQSLVPDWNRRLQQAGIRSYCVECEIVGNPRLPEFD